MAKWKPVVITQKGLELLAKVGNGGTLHFTRMALGSGKPSNLSTANNLSSFKQNMNISSKLVKNNTCTIFGTATNEGVISEYAVSELGIFANDPTEGEVLYAITIDDVPDIVPAGNSATVITQRIGVALSVSATNNVSTVISVTGFITAEDATNIANEIVSNHRNLTVLDHPNKCIEEKHIKNGAITDVLIGNRKILDTQDSNNINTSSLQNLLNFIGYELKTIKGTKNWNTKQALSLDALSKEIEEKQPKGSYAHLGKNGKVLEEELPPLNYAHLVEGKVPKDELPNIDSYPVGAIIQTFSKVAPEGYLILDGQEVSRALYPALWEHAQSSGVLITESEWDKKEKQNESVGYFSTGDGNTTFRIPKLKSYIRASSPNEVGSYQDDAIRNIEGGFSGAGESSSSSYANTLEGAFYRKEMASSKGTWLKNDGNKDDYFGFDASRVVPTADENRPKTVKLLFCIKAYSGEVNIEPSDLQSTLDALDEWAKNGDPRIWEFWEYTD